MTLPGAITLPSLAPDHVLDRLESRVKDMLVESVGDDKVSKWITRIVSIDE